GEREAARGGREEIGGVPAYDLLVLRPTQVGVRSAHGERGNTEKKQEKSRHSRAPSASRDRRGLYLSTPGRVNFTGRSGGSRKTPAHLVDQVVELVHAHALHQATANVEDQDLRLG